jgi:hypothetical protein
MLRQARSANFDRIQKPGFPKKPDFSPRRSTSICAAGWFVNGDLQ